MSDTTPTIEQLQAQIAERDASIVRLEATLKKVRAESKIPDAEAIAAARFAPVRTALGLGEDAGEDAILAAVSARAKEATDAKTAADAIRAERAAERIDAAIGTALGKSGMIAVNHEDAKAMLRGVLEVNKDGAIVTKAGAPNIIAGMTVEQHIHGVLKAARPHWWGVSQGGGASGGKHGASTGDAIVFDPRSSKFSVTGQALYERNFGTDAARRAARQFGGSLAGEGGRR